jgi:hypothetical protein
MKKILLLLFVLICAKLSAQDFNKNLASARSAYASGKLEDARFAIQQMMNDIDVIVGKEIVKLLPTKMDAMAANVKSDNVTANTGIAGVVIHRDYGTGEKLCNIDIIGNSPMVATINAFLSLPFMGNSGDGSQKVVKLGGYKGMLQKSVDSETNKTDFTLQVPVRSTLLTFTVPNSTEADVMRLANTIPVQEIAKLVQ